MKIQLPFLWTLIVGTAVGMVYIFDTFALEKDLDDAVAAHGSMVTNEQFQQYAVEAFYVTYYELEQRRDDADELGNDALATELSRQMERIRVKICKVDPEWERCDDSG
jgi:hypothetical protein